MQKNNIGHTRVTDIGTKVGIVFIFIGFKCCFCLFQVKDVSPLDQVNLVSYEELNVLIDFLDKECARISKMADQLASCSDKEVMSALRPKQLMQAVKAITTFLGQVETLDITAACDECLKACLEFDKAKGNFDFFC